MDCVIGILCQLVWIVLSLWTKQADFQGKDVLNNRTCTAQFLSVKAAR